ncbi:autophagy-related protein 11-domain-containing protein [Halteromyces radiatus]|uniref:autophagy-related protein 11-domain-containing protein n=1 Tax=Halteromyces radiatus TaxID=101107 RepID=UPI00221F541A|nr:autophagy-related protein 11-domain-containing protein [Halteromyces radiatus]KAI8084749.1 autophagy-related protein 11-domain-containing protein [Halteromyces radiatus]
MVETTFFMGSNNSRIRSAVISTRPEMKDDISAISKISSESSALQLAEDKVKKYEARIQSLEKTLQEYQTYTPPSRLSNKGTTIEEHRNNLLTIDPSKSGSHGSSIFSVLENDMENETGLDTANNGKDKTVTEEQVSKLQQEIANLQETVQQREAFIGKMHEQLLREQQMHQQYQDQSEHDKEDLRLQIQEYEQLLEEERQTYEDNRKSFMREAQIKDNLTDIRIADIETELKTKLKHLTETVEAEQKQKAELGTRHEQELLELKETHKKELAMAIQHVEDNHKVEKSKLEKALETLRQEYMDYRQETTASKQEADEKWNQLVSEMNNSEEARNEIKQRLAQARDMVSRAENDWMEKQEALEKLKSIHDNACTIILGLVTKLNSELTRSLYKREDDDIISLLDILTRELDVVVVDMKDAQQKIGVLENNYNEACQQFEIVNEEKMEWHSLSVHMAQKLDDVRRNIIFEVTNQLQLPVDEDEAGAMTRKIISLDSTTEQQDTSIYNDILMAANVIDSAKFVSKIRKKVRNAHELTRRWQKEYKDLKEKYSKLTNSAHEKIAFRNFKVGDVALFLPTRNSTGKPWAAFNINAPHYFLKPSEAIANQMNSREWIVARITSITECVVNAQDPKTNPYGLSDQLVFYQLEVENWRNARQRHHHKKSRQDKSATASEESSSSATPTTDTTTINPTVQRRYTLPNINNRDIGLASISSSLIEKSPQTGSPTTSISQQTSLPSNGSIPISSSYQQQEQYGPLISTSPPLSSSVASSSRPSPFQFARGASSNIVHSTTVSSPALSGGQDLNHSRRGGTENLNDMSQTGDPTSFSSSIDPSLIWTSGE